jgi:hypothetical protein
LEELGRGGGLTCLSCCRLLLWLLPLLLLLLGLLCLWLLLWRLLLRLRLLLLGGACHPVQRG